MWAKNKNRILSIISFEAPNQPLGIDATHDGPKGKGKTVNGRQLMFGNEFALENRTDLSSSYLDLNPAMFGTLKLLTP